MYPENCRDAKAIGPGITPLRPILMAVLVTPTSGPACASTGRRPVANTNAPPAAPCSNWRRAILRLFMLSSGFCRRRGLRGLLVAVPGERQVAVLQAKLLDFALCAAARQG